MKQHVYQFALRRADDERKQFVIETDTVYTENKLTKEQAEQIADTYKCDVKITYIGVLAPTKNEEVITADYHTKEMIEEKIIEWKDKEREAFANGTNEQVRV